MIKEFSNNSYIKANKIEIGKDFQIGKNVQINVRGTFKIGDYSRFGDDVIINAEKCEIGNHFYHLTPGLNIGGGGSQFKEAVIGIGNRCVFHNNYINIARAVYIGNDVGLSPDVDIITHGFWNSVLEGYPCEYGEVIIHDGVIIGQRSFILPNTTMEENIVIGANSTVKGKLDRKKSIYAGTPAKFIRKIIKFSLEERKRMLNDVIEGYIKLKEYKRMAFKPYIWTDYPEMGIQEFKCNVETKEYEGEENNITDDFRDYLRRYGIKIYTERPFGNLTV